MHIGHYHSPIGLVEVRGSPKGIAFIKFTEEEHPEADVHPVLQDCMDRLHAYFDGKKDAFVGMALAIHAAEFQLSVLEELMKIPHGETITYGEIADRIQKPKAVRAVGTAVGRNPLSLVLPCHRVLPASGKTGEYAWGSWRKEWLLNHEQQ